MEENDQKNNFAYDQLTKYGWKQGKGLGLKETGSAEALKVKLKFDSTGLGHDRAEEFKFRWWDHVYNKAANNLSVTSDKNGGIRLERNGKLQVSKTRPSNVSNKAKLYGTFVKGSTLHGSNDVPEVAGEDQCDMEEDLSLKISDDELFRLCGGQTAHKAARHGFKMSGKLARIQAQEDELLESWRLQEQLESENRCSEEYSCKRKSKLNDKKIKEGLKRTDEELFNETRRKSKKKKYLNKDLSIESDYDAKVKNVLEVTDKKVKKKCKLS